MSNKTIIAILALGIFVGSILTILAYQGAYNVVDATQIALQPNVQPTIIAEKPLFTNNASALHIVALNYTLKGNNYQMLIPLNDNLAREYRTKEPLYACIKYEMDRTRTCGFSDTQLYYIRYAKDKAQDAAITDIVNVIKGQTADKDDQVRIAVSLVQQIPYDSDKASVLNKSTIMRFPYEVIYDGRGLCSEKSLLLTALLEKLGYGSSLLLFVDEKHMVVGIEAPDKYTFGNTSYAFVETTAPSIITDATGRYSNFDKLKSDPVVYPISDGKSMDSVFEEYTDSKTLHSLNDMGEELPSDKYNEWVRITNRYHLAVA
jgi:hypothetical protein